MSPPTPQDWLALDQEVRDAAYDNGKATEGREVLVAARDEAARRWRATHPAMLDLPYGDRPRQRWDFFPAADPGAPCLVFIHGGYWQYNGRENFSHLTEGLAAHGWSVAMPGYTLAPDATLSGIVAEIHRALDWLARQGPGLGVAGPVLLSGWSAGAHLAATCLDHPLAVAGLAISGIYDLSPLRQTYVNAMLHLSDEEVERLSPLRQPACCKRLAVVYGSRELPEMRRQSRDFHAARAEAHRPGALIPIAGADHFRILDSLQSPHGEVVQAARTLLEQDLSEPPGDL